MGVSEKYDNRLNGNAIILSISTNPIFHGNYPAENQQKTLNPHSICWGYGGSEMIEAFVLLTLEADKVEKVLKEIKKKVPEVKEAKGVTGPYDAIVRIEAPDLKELTRRIVSDIYRIDGVIDTTTAIVIESADD